MVDSIGGKIALVTGGSSRIGRVICRRLAKEGVNVVVHYNSSMDEALKLRDELIRLGVKAWAIRADLARPSEVMGLVDEAFRQAGEVNYLVNNASVFPRVSIRNVNFDDLNLVMQVNAWAPLMLSLRFSQMVKEGKIVNVIDSIVDGYNFERYPYYLSKVMLTAVTRSLALRLAPGITVNAVAPGIILPAADEDEGKVNSMVNQVPLRRRGTPEDVAEAVVFLLKSSYITGQVIYVDGGEHLKPRVVYDE